MAAMLSCSAQRDEKMCKSKCELFSTLNVLEYIPLRNSEPAARILSYHVQEVTQLVNMFKQTSQVVVLLCSNSAIKGADGKDLIELLCNAAAVRTHFILHFIHYVYK